MYFKMKPKKITKEFRKLIKRNFPYACLLILFLLAPLQTHGSNYRQGITISLQDATLENVFKEINQQTGYSFVYTKTKLRRAKKVSIEVFNSSLNEVLCLCFQNQPLTYTIVGKTVVVKPEKKIGCCSCCK